MSILSEILKEEYDRLNATIFSYQELVDNLPRGSIVSKKIKGIDYSYLQWREKNKVKSIYIRKNEIDEIVDQITKRKNYELEIKKMKESKKEFDKIIGKEL